MIPALEERNFYPNITFKSPDLDLVHVFPLDAPGLLCDLESYWCERRAASAGGFDEHHHWPEFLGGPGKTTDKLTLCAMHHRRIHALIRLMVESGTTVVRTLVYFTPSEHAVAAYGVARWLDAGHPPIAGWSCPAAVAA